MRNLRLFFVLVILIISLTKCKQNNGFLIKGHIDGIDDGTLITLYDFDQQADLDSAYSLNGNFIFEGHVEFPTGFWIKCKNESATIQVENTEMTFSSTLNDMRYSCVVKGGDEQKLQTELDNLQGPYVKTSKILFDSLWNKKYSNDIEKQKLIIKYNKVGTALNDIYVNFGKSHRDSYLGLTILYGNRDSYPKDTLIQIYEDLTPKLKEAPNAQALKTFLYEELAQKGKLFIDFKAKTLSGEDFILSSLKGKYIFLSFWSAGCGPCRMENRFISRNFNEIPKDLSIVSFSLDKNEKYWKEASKQDSIIWHNVIALDSEYGRIKNIYDVHAMPTAFLIDRDGTIIEKFLGYNTDEVLIKQLKTIVGKRENKR